VTHRVKHAAQKGVDHCKIGGLGHAQAPVAVPTPRRARHVADLLLYAPSPSGGAPLPAVAVGPQALHQGLLVVATLGVGSRRAPSPHQALAHGAMHRQGDPRGDGLVT